MTLRTGFALAGLCCLAACEKLVGAPVGNPERVADLRVASVGLSTLTIEWTEVKNGSKNPAHYLLLIDSTAIAWPAVAAESLLVVEGDSVGRTRSHTFENLGRGKEYRMALVSFRGSVDSAIANGKLSNQVAARTDVDDPGEVENLSVFSVGSTDATVSWTQVDDGSGNPASYLVAIGSPTLDWTTARATARVVPGTNIGAPASATYTGLNPSTSYQVQVATVRGTPSDTSTASLRSNLVSFSTTATPAVLPFFSDNFDAGARTNANDFVWTMPGSRVTVSNERSFSGTHSIKFRFGPDTTGGDSSAEQRFSLGRNLTEVWIEYMLYVPANYVQRPESPSNNKFIRIWGDAYEARNKVGASTWSTPSLGSKSGLRFDYIKTGGSGMTASGSPTAEFASSAMLGNWTRIRVHFRYVSADGAADGLMQIWFGDDLVLDYQNIDQRYEAAQAYWNAGYFMGWANTGFATETSFFIDNVRFFLVNPGW